MGMNYNEGEQAKFMPPVPTPTPATPPTPMPTPTPVAVPAPVNNGASGLGGITDSLDSIGDGFIGSMRGFMPKLNGMTNSAVRRGALKINLLLTAITLLFFYIFPAFNVLPVSFADTIHITGNALDIVDAADEETDEFDVEDLKKEDKDAYEIFEGVVGFVLFGKFTMLALAINVLVCLYTLITDKFIPFVTSRLVSVVALVMMALMFVKSWGITSKINDLIADNLPKEVSCIEDDLKVGSFYIFVILASTIFVAFTGFLISPKKEQ